MRSFSVFFGDEMNRVDGEAALGCDVEGELAVCSCIDIRAGRRRSVIDEGGGQCAVGSFEVSASSLCVSYRSSLGAPIITS